MRLDELDGLDELTYREDVLQTAMSDLDNAIQALENCYDDYKEDLKIMYCDMQQDCEMLEKRIDELQNKENEYLNEEYEKSVL